MIASAAPSSQSDRVPENLARLLGHYIVRRRRLNLLRAAGRAATVFLVLILLECAADRFWRLGTPARVIWLATALVAGVAAGAPALWQLGRRHNWLRAAAHLERVGQFNERLATVTSQYLLPVEQRGSPAMLDQIMSEVVRDARALRQRDVLPVRPIVQPWLLLLFVGLIVASVWSVPAIHARELLGRALMPTQNIGAVTTTHIVSISGSMSMVENRAFSLMAEVQPAGEQAPVLHFMIGEVAARAGLRGRAALWSEASMTRGSGSRYTYAFRGPSEGLRYFVTAADATSDIYVVHVLHRPVVTRFQISYTYPEYLGIAAAQVENTDGVLIAPAGTRADISVVGNEPLARAVLRIGTSDVEMQASAAPTVRRARIVIAQNQPLSLLLTSSENVTGQGPRTMAIRAIADEPPVVHLIEPAGDLEMSPMAVVPVEYRAQDDYGITSLELRERINDQPERTTLLRLSEESRIQEGTIDLDLAARGVKVGDVYSIRMMATDTAGQQRSSEETARILISPRSIEPSVLLAASDLERAGRSAGQIDSDLTAALEVLDAAAGRDAADPDAGSGPIHEPLARAAEASRQLRDALLEVTVRGTGPEMAMGCAQWLDEVEQFSGQIGGADLTGGDLAALRARIVACRQQVRQLRTPLETVIAGERARLLVAQRLDLHQTPGAPGGADVTQFRQRATALMHTEAAELGLDDGATSFDEQLTTVVNSENQVLAAIGPVDFAAAARQWADRLARAVSDRATADEETPQLRGRLSLASQAEAMRPDADYVRARDLGLASRAAAALETLAITGSETGGGVEQFPGAMAALQREHALYRAPPASRSEVAATGPAAIHDQAEAARQQMMRWAAGPLSRDEQLLAADRAARNYAMSANAALAQRDYRMAGQMDQAVLHGAGDATTMPSIAASSPSASSQPGQAAMATGAGAIGSGRAADLLRAQRRTADAQQIQQLQRRQEQLARATTDAVLGSNELARQQQVLADAIGQLRAELSRELLPPDDSDLAVEADSRGSAIRAIRAAQIRLIGLTGDLTNTRQASEGASATTQFGAQPSAPPKIDAGAGDSLARSLAPFVPQTEPAVAVLSNILTPALQQVAAATSAGDGPAVRAAIDPAINAVQQSQAQLARSLASLTDQAPMAAADALAQTAAQELTDHDTAAAVASQNGAAAALASAWEASVHRAGRARLSLVPSLFPRVDLSADAMPDTAAGPSTIPAGLRAWGRLPMQPGGDISASHRDFDSPEYQDALRAYFQALGADQGEKAP